MVFDYGFEFRLSVMSYYLVARTGFEPTTFSDYEERARERFLFLL
jgi:hypothetical protein